MSDIIKISSGFDLVENTGLESNELIGLLRLYQLQQNTFFFQNDRLLLSSDFASPGAHDLEHLFCKPVLDQILNPKMEDFSVVREIVETIFGYQAIVGTFEDHTNPFNMYDEDFLHSILSQAILPTLMSFQPEIFSDEDEFDINVKKLLPQYDPKFSNTINLLNQLAHLAHELGCLFRYYFPDVCDGWATECKNYVEWRNEVHELLKNSRNSSIDFQIKDFSMEWIYSINIKDMPNYNKFQIGSNRVVNSIDSLLVLIPEPWIHPSKYKAKKL